MRDDELRTPQMGLGLGEDVDLMRFQQAAALETAPKEMLTPRQWIKKNLFSSPWNGALTVVAGIVAGLLLVKLFTFVFVEGEWEIVRSTLKGYMVGSFPLEELWRVWACLFLITLLGGVTYGAMRPKARLDARRWIVTAVLAVAAVAFVLFAVKTTLVRALLAAVVAVLFAGIFGGRTLGRRRLRRPLIAAWLLAFPIVIVIVRVIGSGVPPRLWEGFFFNIIAATVGIFVSFPIGIGLALGRRSNLPAIRLINVIFIEIFRGVPLVAWLIISKYVVDLVLPPQLDVPDIVKAFLAMVLFSSAYVAEIVRGGLQGIQFGQYEAGRALGLSTSRLMALVILPQALRSTIPAMISHFISLFKDTSLFVAIEVSDLLAVARNSANNPIFLGHDMEALLFAGLTFWIVAFSMARWSQRLERRLGVGER